VPHRSPLVVLLAAAAVVLSATGAYAATPRSGWGQVTAHHSSSQPAARGTLTPAPWFGVLGVGSMSAAPFTDAGFSRVTLQVGWDNYEPKQGVFNPGVITQAKQALARYRAQGATVILDPGLQYPPSWVFDLPGQTRFVNQYGDVWHGGLSEDVPNAVYNPAVRAAEGDYLRRLAADLSPSNSGPANIAAVRVGGLLSGELRYPPSTSSAHRDALWMYGSQAQSQAAVPGWKPGAGAGKTAATARTALQGYFNALTRYESWQLSVLGSAFPAAQKQLLLPSWGIRPGMVDAAIAGGFSGRTVAENGQLLTMGLDWASQVKVLAAVKGPKLVYTTWLDAPSQGTSPAQVPPVAFLAGLAAKYGMPLGGENTGGGGVAALQTSLHRVTAYGLAGMMWMSAADLMTTRDGLGLSAAAAGLQTLLPHG
jgi:hypothetical protein